MLAVALAAFGAVAGYWLASRHTPPHDMNPSGGEAAEGRKVLYWYDPMAPGQRFDKPGKSPYMDMELVAKYADEDVGGDGGGASVRIDPGVSQNLGLRLAKVERGALPASVEAVGMVSWNDRQVAIVQTRSAGFVEHVYARAPGDVIARGAPLVDLLVPEWSGAQTEFLAMLDTGDASLIQAARERMRLLGMSATLIARIEATRRVYPVITISAPIGGVIQTLDVRAGMSLGAGMSLARINGFDPVWLEAAIPEAQAGRVAPGNRVSASLSAYPGQRLTGKVIAVLPEANAESRTLRVRVELPNADGRLKAGMFAQISLAMTADAPVLQVPSEAVIRTGTRDVLLLALEGGRFQPVEVRLGSEANGKVAVLDGVSEGQSIVASGQFLIDSEASLKSVLARFPLSDSDPGSANAADIPAATLNEADGKVESINDSEIVLSHGPVKSLGWPSMTMPFRLARPNMAMTLKPGEQVHFGFRQSNDGYVIEQLERH
jgi:Cu(I)/Ag(I) efflux system membrane fusion protein